MSVFKFDADDFTIGILCANHFEALACRIVLDEPYLRPRLSDGIASGPFSYGRIGAHNVVIAPLPQGIHGIVEARGAAENLCRKHTKVRMGILVGVGGGVPSADHDVRLGDVVVSVPDKARGAVIQHDFITAKQYDVEHYGILNLPPKEFLTAVAAIRNDDELGLSTFRAIVYEKTTLTEYANYKKPASEDILFCAECDQPQGQEDCHACRAKRREPRIEVTTPSPVVHYGTIASGDTLLRNAKIRDELYKKFRCLCIDMEGAGIMNSFPCIVVRGISNYCDSHKNDDWQRYAAITAAAWTKEFLGRVAVIDVKKATPAMDVIGKVISRIEAENANTRREISQTDAQGTSSSSGFPGYMPRQNFASEASPGAFE